MTEGEFLIQLLNVLQAGSAASQESLDFLDQLTEVGGGDPGEIYVRTEDDDNFVITVKAM